MITIQELLYNRGLKRNVKIKLVRHKDVRQDLYDLYKNHRSEFLSYQSSQSKDVFKDVEYIVSFIGEEGIFARFIGVYQIKDRQKFAEDRYHYEMIEVPEQYDDLKERVIIRWSNG
ncbi:hypothetical protein NK356_01980 [Chryseobacterium sp. S0630]|uniref:hypothetical protein n=1 Tax=Chryseobacterium sp. S0630 TaxID=2957803 RepID=UPI00209F2422|nr:hypothetical protein [Chryseobacterium sp. S0630]MCP1297942.1 hypothetical protein [Chryseobacterium sp. S0630]